MLPLFVAAAAGAALGLFYFGGLFLTIRTLSASRHPALLTLASFVLRTVVVVLGLYAVMDGEWRRLVSALAGFLVVRTVLVRRLGRRRGEAKSG